MKVATLLIGCLLCSAASAQDVSIIVWQPVVVPARIVFVPRGGPIRRALWGPYQMFVVPKAECQK